MRSNRTAKSNRAAPSRQTLELRGQAPYARATVLIAGIASPLLLAYCVVTSSPSGRLVGFIAAALCALAVVRSIFAMRDKRAQLAIGPAGLMYRNFSTKTIEWREITTVAVFRYIIGSSRRRSLDAINFAVADFARYPGSPFRSLWHYLQKMAGRPPIVIQPWFIDATTEQIVDAIQSHWRGKIAVFDLKKR